MKIISWLSEIHVLLFFKSIPYMFSEYWGFTKSMVRCSMSKSPAKLLTEIMMLAHALEKAFSLPHIRKGFGVAKVTLLTNYISKYIKKYGYSISLEQPFALIYAYLDFQKALDFSDDRLIEVEEKVENLVYSIPQKIDRSLAGSFTVSKEEMLSLTQINFEKLAKGRHSFRHFGKEPVLLETIKKALDIARFSPSACNRQAYRAHIFSGEQKNLILHLQGGANSFYKEADKAILVTSDCNRYFSTEMHLPYVDGALFAMSLMYALSSLGVASIPLTMSRKLYILKKIESDLNLPKNEVPVILIAIGNYPQNARISKSHRDAVDYLATFH